MESKKDKKEIDKNLKLIAKSSFIIFVGLLISKILAYTYRIIIARSFGPEVYGLFSLAIMILGWFVLFGSLGFSEGLLRYLAWYRGKKQYSKIKYLFKKTVSITLFTGIVSAILLFLLADFISISIFHNPELIVFLKVFSFLIPIYLFANIFLSVLQAFEKIQWYSFILNVFQNIVKVLFLIILIILGFKTRSIIFSYFLSFLLMSLLAYFVCKYKTKEIFGKYNLTKKIKKETKREFFSYSLPLLFVVAMSEILYWTDTFFIGYFKTVSYVGFYNAAVPIVFLLLFVPEIFLKLFFPLITKEYSQRRLEVVKQLSQQVGKWIFILVLPLFLIMFLFPGVIINILFGSEYLIASNALKILSIGGFLSSLMWIHNNLLFMAGKSKLILYNLVAVVTLNIVLNIFLIPVYGIDGAAIATTISKVFLSIALFVEVKYFLSIIPYRRKILQIALVSFIPTMIVLLIKRLVPINIVSLMLVGLLFVLVYFFLIIITKSLDKNDLMILRAIKKKLFR